MVSASLWAGQTAVLEITCETCGKDITYTGNSIDWRLEIHNVRMRKDGSGHHRFRRKPTFDATIEGLFVFHKIGHSEGPATFVGPVSVRDQAPGDKDKP
jgi:hypothetical protein